MAESELPDHIARNRAYWDRVNAPRYVESGRRSWATNEITWGIFGVPETELRALPKDVAGMDVIELGCGTAYVSAWLARRGARPTGIDNSAEQLGTARSLQNEHDLHFPLIHGNAEATGLPDASFDLAVSEYGASIWADPYRWIPEAARLLRPGGELVFLTNGTLWILTVPDAEEESPATERLLRPYFGMHRFEWPDNAGVEFDLGFGDWIRLLRVNGFEVIDFIEVQAPVGAIAGAHSLVDPEWARSGLQSRSGESATPAASATIASMDLFTGLAPTNDVEVDVVGKKRWPQLSCLSDHAAIGRSGAKFTQAATGKPSTTNI
jgi:SAM-dependent methyltransferase